MGVAKKDNYKNAREFINSGKITHPDLNNLAQECSKYVRGVTEKSSAEAIEIGKSFLKIAKSHKGVLLQTAFRTLGWALLSGGEFAQAEKSYLKARELVKKDPLLRSRIDRVLIDIYMYLGNFKESRRRARLSMNTFIKYKKEDELARTRVNYANTLHRQDRHEEALSLYRQARKYFVKKKNALASAFCYYNEANTLVQLFEFDKAKPLYLRARKIFKKENYDLHANGCRYGLAWLYMLEGKYHIALKRLQECEEKYKESSQPREVILCQLDRAETYIGLNLFADARRVAAQAEKSAKGLGINYESAKAAFFYAKASLAIGNTADARKALLRAKAGFSIENNNAYLASVELASIPFENDSRSRIAKSRMARKKFGKAQLPLWEAICDLQILSDFPDDEIILQRLAKNPAIGVVPHLLARWHTMKGDRLARQGNIDDAIGSWEKACKVLDSVRAKLPPVDMRTAFLKSQGDPYCRLIQAQFKENPLKAAAWSERYKTAGLWQIDAQIFNKNEIRDKAEKSLVELAAHVSAYSNMLEKVGPQRSTLAVSDSKITDVLQEKVRHSLIELDMNLDPKEFSIDNACRHIMSIASEIPIVQFHSGGQDIIVFVHFKGQSINHRYLDGVRIAREFMTRWRFHIERMPYLTKREMKISLKEEMSLLQQIGQWLLEPLELTDKSKKLLILPEGKITNFPWQALIYKNRALADQFEIALAPSLRHYVQARSNKTKSRRIEVFVGNTEGLNFPQKEIEMLEKSGSHDTAIYSPGYRNDWPNNGRAMLWHYSGHSILRKDNPFYSSLPMEDGPLFAADFRLRKNIVNLVTLAACRTGQQSFLAGEEATGLVRSLLEMGARNVLASQWAVVDDSTAEWMLRFYKSFLSGESILSSVRNTALEMRDQYPSAYHWAAFLIYGAG